MEDSEKKYYVVHLGYEFEKDAIDIAKRILNVFLKGVHVWCLHSSTEDYNGDKVAKIIVKFHDSGLRNKKTNKYPLLSDAIWIETILGYSELYKLLYYSESIDSMNNLRDSYSENSVNRIKEQFNKTDNQLSCFYSNLSEKNKTIY